MGRQNDGLVSHEEGLAYLLDVTANNGCRNEFDTLVFAVIAIPVVSQLFFMVAHISKSHTCCRSTQA